MKKSHLIIVLLFISSIFYAQETFKKKYYIPISYNLLGNQTIYLKTDSVVTFKNLPDEEKDKIKNYYKSLKTFTKEEEILIDGKMVIVTKDVIADESFFESLTFKSEKKVTDNDIVANVLFNEDGTLYVNRYLLEDVNGNFTRFPVAYYKLQDRQKIKLWFREFTVSALVVPIKYRFKGKNGLNEDFSSGVGGNVFIGYSIGKTSFFHQKKVGNKSNTWKITPGFLVGASTVVLNASNTSLSTNPITGSTQITKGLLNLGFGLTYSFNKINIGAFIGEDIALGQDANRWNYNKKPWLGIGVGYSLFNF